MTGETGEGTAPPPEPAIATTAPGFPEAWGPPEGVEGLRDGGAELLAAGAGFTGCAAGFPGGAA
ncbi:hypothetical protein P3T26_001302 [Streptomyces sp. MAA16]|nr:hypothetical protein [Streptomyces sp. MAA16]